jgi:hypothetical protein
MQRFFVTAAIAMAIATPVFAAGSSCSSAPESQWQPQSKLETMLKGEGLKVLQVKIEKGCYEVYATDKGGKRVNLAYNAETLQKLDNPEAGEN